MKRIRRIIYVLIPLLIILLICTFVYGQKHPITVKIDNVEIVDFLSSDHNKVDYEAKFKKADKDNPGAYERIFNNSEDLISTDPDDYIRVYYYLKGTNHTPDLITGIRTIISDFPENDHYYYSSPILDPESAGSIGSTTLQCNLIICKKGLTEDEIKDKIRAVSIDVLYNHRGKADKVSVEGIDELKSSDITFKEW